VLEPHPNCIKRLRFFEKEVVIFREDLMNRMRRNSVVPPNDEDSLVHHVRSHLKLSFLMLSS